MKRFTLWLKKHQFVSSLVMVCLAAAVGYMLSPFFGYRVVALQLLFVVSCLAMVFDIWPVILTAAISAVVWNFFFIPPRFTFSIRSTEDSLMFMMYFMVALVNAVLTTRIRKMEKQALRREEKEKSIALYNTWFNALSHELKTPIAAIIAASDSMKDNQAHLSEHHKRELVGEIAIAADRLHEQVINLLNMSRLESGHLVLKKDWCDVRELLYTVSKKFGDKMKNHSVRISVPDHFPFFFLDWAAMELILHNLLDNAIKYSPPNTCIDISANYTTSLKGDLSESADKITASCGDTEYQLVIAMIDHGPGFPPDQLENAFDSFYRMENVRPGGTGLGLSIVRGFVEAHQGAVRLQNSGAGGAQFTIEIPAKASFISFIKHE